MILATDSWLNKWRIFFPALVKNLTPDIFYFTHDLPPPSTRESSILPLLNFAVGTSGRYFCRTFSIESSVFQRNRPMTYQEMFCLVTVLAARAATGR